MGVWSLTVITCNNYVTVWGRIVISLLYFDWNIGYSYIPIEDPNDYLKHRVHCKVQGYKPIYVTARGASKDVNALTSVQNIHFYQTPPPLKKCTHQHFSKAKHCLENAKNLPKMLKVYRNQHVLPQTPTPLLPNVYVLYTHENVDILADP